MGMKKEGERVSSTNKIRKKNLLFVAVQKERDRLGRQRSSNINYVPPTIKTSPRMSSELNEGDDDDLSVMALVKAEKTAQEVLALIIISFDIVIISEI